MDSESHLRQLNDFLTKRIQKGLATDRDRWICIRQSFARGVSADFLGGEYDKLVADPRVGYLVVTEDEGVKLYTQRVIKKLTDQYHRPQRVFLSRSVVSLEFHKYSFELCGFRFDPPVSFFVQCLETGNYTPTELPKYFFNKEIRANGFCFGDYREPYLQDLAEQGEFFQLYMGVLQCLWHVNPTDVMEVLTNHRKVLDDGTIEPHRYTEVTETGATDEVHDFPFPG